ncbi:flagellar filament capping protein FliD [Paucibacter sp. Y2R2-4]|uniref:flagellar filament capping protein FliD n=1 Tax=Paucibacter sp. Y2R2-4 TaxID=2893553 RepID=UPI0021E41F31|nr:flagellar filament capping protein FliD [Paucibacter sp. Y2R2-4]MCV2351831.1 flagellar filament capping protein FliD [Paucibacter sp. Y2R2-4]
MPSITSAGIGSGLDIESLIGKLVAVERTPINQLKTRTDKLQTQLSSYGKVQAALSAMRDAAAKLTSVNTWGANLGTSSDATAVTVNTGAGAPAGNISVQVNRLASVQSLSSKVLPSTGPIGQGRITIDLGKWTDAPAPAPGDPPGLPTFTPKPGTSVVSIDITDGANSLSQIRDKINAAGAGVQASIVTDNSGSRLVMRSTETGESNGFKISVLDADGVVDNDGLSSLAYDPGGDLAIMKKDQSANNADVLLNGLKIDSPTNTLKDSIEGLTIGLQKTTSSEVTLAIGADKEAIKKTINDFMTAYNSVATLMRDQTKYDAGNKTAGPLQGETTVVSVNFQMRVVAAGTTTLGGKFSRLSDIGLDPSADGTLKLNATKLDAALGDLSNLKQMFMGTDSANSSNNGLAQQLRSFADQVLGADGRLTNRQAGLKKSIDDNGKASDRLETKVSLTEKRLRDRYTALDVQMGQLNGLSTYVTQQMKNLVK